MSVELSPDLLALLTDMKATLHDLQAEVAAVRAELRAKTTSPPESRAWYSVEEVAGMLGKSPYTVREWCRHGQVNAAKRAERRGAAALWSISAEEVTRYRDEGLLPIDPDRNNRN